MEEVKPASALSHDPCSTQPQDHQQMRSTAVEENTLNLRTPLQWGELDPYRRGRTHVGMWAWILQRVSAVGIVICLILHLFFTYKPFIQFLLLTTLAFHAALGLRVILLDFNLVNIRHQRDLIYWLLGIAAAGVLLVWGLIY